MLLIFKFIGLFDKICDLLDIYNIWLDLLVFEYVFIELIYLFE